MKTRRSAIDMRVEAVQLARALRSGLAFRWPISSSPTTGPGPFPPGGNIRAFLTPYADSLDHQQLCRRKLLNRVIRWLRYLARSLITPWLRVQTHFNFASVSVIEQLEQRIRALESSAREMRQMIEEREKVLRESP
jgi:hypothetical protein